MEYRIQRRAINIEASGDIRQRQPSQLQLIFNPRPSRDFLGRNIHFLHRPHGIAFMKAASIISASKTTDYFIQSLIKFAGSFSERK